jgi:pyruvate,water dikinase
MSKIDQKQYLRWLKDCKRSDFALVGGKNANLGEMIKADFPVPFGFAVTVESYKETLAGGGLVKEIQDALFGLDVKHTDSIDKAGQYIRGLIEAQPMPPVVEEQVRNYYEALCREHGIRNLPVAVRSSATAEDSPSASFAGQQDTYLWVKGDELIPAIVKCQASLFTSRAIAYRTRMGFLHDKVFISVGVQKMVHARAAGVMFTLNPANGDRSKIMIGGSWGFGETVVSGEVTPDEWQVDKVVLEIIKEKTSPKLIQRIVDSTSEKVITVDIPSDKQTISCLDKEEIIELAKFGKRIEQHFGLPQDIEWIIDKDLPFPGNIFIVQTRPETVWSLKKGESKLKTAGKATADVIQFWLNIKA